MIAFSEEVWHASITGTATAYTDPKWNSVLSRAEKFYCVARVSAGSGTSPTLTVNIEHSNDGVNWATKAQLFNATSISNAATSVVILTAQDLGTAQVGGLYMRVALTLGGTNPSAMIVIMLTGRDPV